MAVKRKAVQTDLNNLAEILDKLDKEGAAGQFVATFSDDGKPTGLAEEFTGIKLRGVSGFEYVVNNGAIPYINVKFCHPTIQWIAKGELKVTEEEKDLLKSTLYSLLCGPENQK